MVPYTVEMYTYKVYTLHCDIEMRQNVKVKSHSLIAVRAVGVRVPQYLEHS